MPHFATVDGVNYPLPHMPTEADIQAQVLADIASGASVGILDSSGVAINPNAYVEPPPPAPFNLAEFNIDWTQGALFGSGTGGHKFGVRRRYGDSPDMYGGDFSDPFGRLMFATFGAAGKYAAEDAAPAVVGAAEVAYDAATGAAADVAGALTPQFDWMEDMAKIGVIGLGAIAIIMLAK